MTESQDADEVSYALYRISFYAKPQFELLTQRFEILRLRDTGIAALAAA